MNDILIKYENKFQYIGNCIEIGDENAYISEYFNDASELACMLEDDENILELTRESFLTILCKADKDTEFVGRN